MEVVVEYEYEAQEPDELTLKKGDRITNVTQALEGWYNGTLGNKTGLFPDNFVKIVSKSTSNVKTEPVENSPVQLRQKKPAGKSRRLKVLFSYSAEQEDELSLEVNDIIEFISEVEDGWYKGSLKGQVGIFPSNFVTEVPEVPALVTNGPSAEAKKVETKLPAKNPVPLKTSPDVVPVADRKSFEDEPAPQLPPKPVRELAQCFYPYVAQNEDELTLNEGDIVTIISKYCEDDGWWRGELRGKIGLFPDNFVKIISTSDATRGAILNSSQSHTHQPKVFASGRNSTGNAGGGVTMGNTSSESLGEATVIDGGVSSKAKEELPPKKATSKPELKESFKDKSNSSSSSPSGFIANLGLKLSGRSKKEMSPNHSVNSSTENDTGTDFSVVERSERLNHLTATRAKPPRRRPPSTLIARDADIESSTMGTDGSFSNSPDASFDFIQSSLPANSTPNGGSPTMPSFHVSPSNHSSLTETSSSVTPHSNRHSLTKDHDGSALSNGNSSPTAVSAQQKQAKVTPWIAELKQIQDKKKAQATSPVIPSPTSTTAQILAQANIGATSTSSSTLTGIAPVPAQRDPSPVSPGLPQLTSRAPPLPAKPQVPEKVSGSSSSPSNGVGSGSAVSAASLKFGGGRKTPTNSIIGVNHTSSASITMSSQVLANNNHNVVNSGSDGLVGLNNNTNEDKPIKRNSLKSGYVTYEEYAKLQDRVFYLESEMECMKKELKILLDREASRGHVV